MQISSRQMQALGVSSRESFARRLGDRIRADFPAFVRARELDEAGVRGLARQLVDRCVAHRVERACDIEAVVSCLLTMKAPADAGRILQREDLSGPEKATLLHDLVVFGRA